MVGGGQLARMTHQAAISLGQSLRVLSVNADDAAALVAADVRLGSHTDLAALRGFADGCDAVTFDHEHVPGEFIRALEKDGVKVYPSADALVFAQDKGRMRERLAELGAPVPRWRRVTQLSDISEFGLPAVAKATTGGYDGRGVWMLEDETQAADLIETGTNLIVEERVPLKRELAALIARSPFGQVAAYPVVETVQQDGICVQVLAPAPGLSEQRALEAQQLAIDLATALGVVGLLAVELFETDDGLIVNELAMRPHNSGHWTIEGSRTSQFEQHLRAVLDYPLGATAMTAPVVVMANILGGAATEPGWDGPALDERMHHLMAHWPDVKLHWYGKGQRPGRKLGHVTALGEQFEEVRARAVAAARYLADGVVDPAFAFHHDHEHPESSA